MIFVLGFFGAVLCLILSFIPPYIAFYEIMEELLISEFLEKRPFKEISLKREAILREILNNVNLKVNHIIGTNYGYTSTNKIVRDYKRIMSKFESVYHEVYLETPLEEIQGWDRILLMAQRVQDKDLKCAYEILVSLELVSNDQKVEQPMNLATTEFELRSINNLDASNKV